MIPLAGTMAVILSFLTHPVASEARGPLAEAFALGGGIVAREWTWVDEIGTTVFTARGPAEQVAAFQPGDPPSECPDCVLMSSVAFGEPESALSAPAATDQPAGPQAGESR